MLLKYQGNCSPTYTVEWTHIFVSWGFRQQIVSSLHCYKSVLLKYCFKSVLLKDICFSLRLKTILGLWLSLKYRKPYANLSLPWKISLALLKISKSLIRGLLYFFTTPSIPYPLICLRVTLVTATCTGIPSTKLESYSPSLADGCPRCLVLNSTFKHQHWSRPPQVQSKCHVTIPFSMVSMVHPFATACVVAVLWQVIIKTFWKCNLGSCPDTWEGQAYTTLLMPILKKSL